MKRYWLNLVICNYYFYFDIIIWKMKRLENKLEKWFGEWIEYKWRKYNWIWQRPDTIWIFYKSNDNIDFDEELSINDLCSPECSFLESLDRLQIHYINIRDIHDNNFGHYEWIQYHRIQLSLLSDEDKILYLLTNTK